MKILQVGPNSVHVERFLGALAQDKSLDLHYLSENTTEFPFVATLPPINFHSLNPIILFRNFRKVVHLLHELQPEIIHLHQINRQAYFVAKAAQKLNIPVISTAWGSDVLLMPKKNKLFKYLVQQTLLNSTHITADAESMIKAMKSLHSKGKYHLLQYGIDPISPKEKEKIIYSNRLHEHLYRIDEILRLFAEFNQKFPDWRLVLAGTGSQTKTLKKLADKLNLKNKVEFIGWVDKATNEQYYAISSFYISIPESDGTAVSLFEALSAACHPILSDLPVVEEWSNIGLKSTIWKPEQNSNPFESALKDRTNETVQSNTKLVEKYALRTTMIDEFKSLYSLSTSK